MDEIFPGVFNVLPTKRMIASLHALADVEFDVLLANTRVTNPICAVEFDDRSRRELIDSILAQL